MDFLFDFGMSQEDPFTEQAVLGIQSGDSVLSLASGGEVPLTLLCLNENIRMTAVDISESQISLCRLKLTTAHKLDFPLNGNFLGYGPMDPEERNHLFREKIQPFLPESDVRFWDRNISFMQNGIIHAGRFEQYIRKMRFAARLFMGGKNLKKLVSSETVDDQVTIFDRDIATRKSLQLLFKVAFHPAIYKKRGLQEQALIHARKNTGERFYSKFRDFCTVNPASTNYFLQFFLTGSCSSELSYPDYLKPAYKDILVKNLPHLELKTISFQDALKVNGKGAFNKIHLSNLGDWISGEQFRELLDLFRENCLPGTRICYRFLQKNHFGELNDDSFFIDNALSVKVEKKDRFPFYGIIPVEM